MSQADKCFSSRFDLRFNLPSFTGVRLPNLVSQYFSKIVMKMQSVESVYMGTSIFGVTLSTGLKIKPWTLCPC